MEAFSNNVIRVLQAQNCYLINSMKEFNISLTKPFMTLLSSRLRYSMSRTM